MAITIENAYIETFEDNVRFLAQQKPSRLLSTVTSKTSNGAALTGNVSALLILQKRQQPVQQRLRTTPLGHAAYHKLKPLITAIL